VYFLCACILVCVGVGTIIFISDIEFFFVETMLLPQDICTFLKSPIVKKCEALAKRPPRDATPNQYYDIRDYLLLRIIQTNAQRTGAVRGITKEHLERAKLADNGGAVVAVSIPISCF